jgi:hypothetical protein
VAARVLKPAAKRAGVPRAGFHTFRHTFATIHFRHGLNAKRVQTWLGHHSPAFTLSVYLHLLPDDLPEAAFPDDLTGGNNEATLPTERPTCCSGAGGAGTLGFNQLVAQVARWSRMTP